VLWEEELASVAAVEKRSSRNGEYLVIRWERKRHFIPLSYELVTALESAMGIRRAPSQEETDDGDAVAVLPVWRCTKCGEENPGNFEVCWKCEAANRRVLGEESPPGAKSDVT
jgi:ribosomal protein L40E